MVSRRFFIGGSVALAGSIALSTLKPLVASSTIEPSLFGANQRSRFFIPTTAQFTKAESEIRSSASLNDLRSDFEAGAQPDFEQTFTIGVEDKLISIVPIIGGGKKNQNSVHASIFDPSRLRLK